MLRFPSRGLMAGVLVACAAVPAAADNPHPDAQWFPEAGFGLFVHWGIASVRAINISWSMRPGSVLKTRRIDDPAERERIVRERDYNLNGRPPLSPEQYWDMAKSFNPSRYDPDRWIQAAKEAGFTYAVLTTRHHEGFALWPSAHGDFNTSRFMDGRDLVRPFVEACRRHGLKVGFYYSPPDWHFDRDYMDFLYPGARSKNPELRPVGPDLAPRVPRTPDAAHKAAYAAMVRGQVEELLTRYGKIDLLWFDGKPAGLSGDQCITLARIRELQPGIVINPRFHGTGDFKTHERKFPAARPSGWAEFCDPWTGIWSHSNGVSFRANGFVLGTLARARAWRMNFLLSTGPMENGDMHADVYENLAELRSWMAANRSSVSGVRPLPAGETASVPATARNGTRFLFAIPKFDGSPIPAHQLPPVAETLTLSGLAAKPASVTLLGTGQALAFDYAKGTLSVPLPVDVRTRLVDVVEISLPD